MDCGEKRFLLRQFIDSNYEYRLALQRCRVCRTCSNVAPGEPVPCQLDEFMTKADQAFAAAAGHACEDCDPPHPKDAIS